jgi:hypothetical protein
MHASRSPKGRGELRRRVVADVTAATLRQAINEDVDSRARLMTDEYSAYRWLKKGRTGTHETVCHRTFELARADVHVNTAESSHALIRRGLIGIYHNVSLEYLHRYLWQFDFLWNNRQMNNGERTIAVIKAAEGKRLGYKDPVAEQAYIRGQEKGGEPLDPFQKEEGYSRPEGRQVEAKRKLERPRKEVLGHEQTCRGLPEVDGNVEESCMGIAGAS